jgi:hypothetical protein
MQPALATRIRFAAVQTQFTRPAREAWSRRAPFGRLVEHVHQPVLTLMSTGFRKVSYRGEVLSTWS